MFYVILAIAAVAAVIGIVFVIRRNGAIKKNGVETESVVIRVKEIETGDEDGSRDVRYTYYVEYQTQDGDTVEAKLGGAPMFTCEGDRLRIKYLPEKPKYVIAA